VRRPARRIAAGFGASRAARDGTGSAACCAGRQRGDQLAKGLRPLDHRRMRGEERGLLTIVESRVGGEDFESLDTSLRRIAGAHDALEADAVGLALAVARIAVERAGQRDTADRPDPAGEHGAYSGERDRRIRRS